MRHSENHMANFLDCVRSREKPAADVELGCRAAIICHIGNIAQWLGRPLQWDPPRKSLSETTERTAGSLAPNASRGTCRIRYHFSSYFVQSRSPRFQ